MNLLSKESYKSERERQVLYDITHTWNLKKYNKLTNKTRRMQIHRYREQTSGYQWREGSREAIQGDRGEKVIIGLYETFLKCKGLQNLKNLSIKKKTNLLYDGGYLLQFSSVQVSPYLTTNFPSSIQAVSITDTLTFH